jgi:hypothetical protein
MRKQMLRAAFSAGNTAIVLNFFRSFLNEHPEARRGSSPQSSAPRSQSSRSFASEAPVTPQDIDRFYRRVREGFYEGKEEQRIKDEVAIHRAVICMVSIAMRNDEFIDFNEADVASPSQARSDGRLIVGNKQVTPADAAKFLFGLHEGQIHRSRAGTDD